jgi:DnaJ family protein B protein 12
MESNRDEATKCLKLARKHYDAGNLPSARKFCLKSISLFETKEATQLLTSIDDAISSPSSSSSSGPSTSTSTATEERPSASTTRQRNTQKADAKPNGTPGGAGGEKREYTAEQHAVVKRVNACKVTEYYEILSVQRDCEESDIKKAYRKVRQPGAHSIMTCLVNFYSSTSIMV